MYRFCAHYIFGYESQCSLCYHFYLCGLTNNKLYRICGQAYYPLVLLRLFFSYCVLNPTCPAPLLHLLLHTESHVSCSVCSFIITCWIPRVLHHFFLCYYISNPTCPVPSVHSLLHTESHVSCSVCSFIITCWIPRVLLHFFICYYISNPTCPAPLLHLLLHIESHVGFDM